jgi:DNA-binding CsgD family transcriptional regulator
MIGGRAPTEGPLRLRLEIGGDGASGLAERVSREGIVIVGADEEADLVARPLGAEKEDGLPLPRLSDRELEILDFLVDGWSNAEIASALKIGVRTVRFHLESIYGKLGASRRGEAVREGLRLGLVRFDA